MTATDVMTPSHSTLVVVPIIAPVLVATSTAIVPPRPSICCGQPYRSRWSVVVIPLHSAATAARLSLADIVRTISGEDRTSRTLPTERGGTRRRQSPKVVGQLSLPRRLWQGPVLLRDRLPPNGPIVRDSRQSCAQCLEKCESHTAVCAITLLSRPL